MAKYIDIMTRSAEYSVIGKSLPRVDGVVKAKGQQVYTDDMVLPRMLYGKILRSYLPHARILSIDTSKAERLPGVKAVITGKDTLGVKFGLWRLFPEQMDEQGLATDKVRFIGDAVAAVAAIDEDIAEEALDLIEVDYEELPAVFDPIEAMKEGAPRIHDNVEYNTSVVRNIEFGDVEEGFRQSDYIREDRFSTQATIHAQMERNVAIASFDPSGKLTMWASIQSPYFLQGLLAMALGMREGDIRVIKPCVGGGFGGKIELFPAHFCAALLSKKTQRPVRIQYTREEDLSTTRTRHPVISNLKSGFKKDGTLVARQCQLIFDGGAFNSMGPTAAFLAGFFSSMPYRFSHYKYDGYHVYTNKVPAGAMRGLGAPQAFFGSECQIDMIADQLGVDPVELRLKNALQPYGEVPRVTRITSCGLSECIEKAAERTGWREKRGKLPDGHGIGMACYMFYCGGIWNFFNTPYAYSAATVQANIDGTVNLYTQASDIGQGSDTVLCQILAEELGVRMEDIRKTVADTEVCPVELGAWASRTTFMAGHAILEAAREVKNQLFEVAAQKLEIGVVHALEAKDGRIHVKGRPEKGITFAEAATAAQRAKGGLPVIGRGSYSPRGKGLAPSVYSFGAQVAEVEVDKETGKVTVRKITTAHDIGMPINPMSVEGQLEGSIHIGQGYALSEELVSDGGKILNPSLVDYKMPKATEMPEIEVIEIRTDEPEAPFGAKEAGEGLVSPTLPAIANAIYDAIGVRMTDPPFTPEKVLRAIKEKEKSQK